MHACITKKLNIVILLYGILCRRRGIFRKNLFGHEEKTMSTIKALMVIYNKHLSDSETIHSLDSADGVDVYIADNSTEDFGNRAFAAGHGYHYIDMDGNKGLSKAYNRIISIMDKNEDIVCLFDDDTIIDRHYFDALRAAAEKRRDIDLFVPIVKDEQGILSPCIINDIECKRVNGIGEIPHNSISAINSGMAIRLKVFQDYRYDEGQFLDYIDHAFIRDVAGNARDKIHIMQDVILKQRFSGSEKSDRAAAEKRYSIFKKDVEHFCKKFGISSTACSLFLMKRKIAMNIKRFL